MSKTWLVFENGSHYSVDCSLHTAPAGHPKPVDAYLLTEHEGDFTIAARKAVHAVFACAEKRGLYQHQGPVIAGFDLSERVNLDAGLAGQSGGLCFALCFAEKLLKKDIGNIAATGVIEADGKIGKVKGIETKLKIAADLVQAQGMIFFPEKNLSDMSQDLKDFLKEKKIKAFPVADIDQVFDILFKKEEPFVKKSFLNKSIVFVVLLVIAGIVSMMAWGYLVNNERTASPLPIKEKQIISSEAGEKPLENKEINKQGSEPETITIKQAIEADLGPEAIKPLQTNEKNPIQADNSNSPVTGNKSNPPDDKGFE
jgi:hypothetical protein